MSLRIDPNKIFGALIAGEWISVDEGTFDIDAYEYIESGDDGLVIHGGGQSDVCATGFTFRTTTAAGQSCDVHGPLTAIQAVKTRRR
jgi:hypothetical protein